MKTSAIRIVSLQVLSLAISAVITFAFNVRSFAQADNFYSFHPMSILGLGKCYDQNDLTLEKRQAFEFSIDTIEKGVLENKLDIYLAIDESKVKESLKIDLNINAHYLKYKGAFAFHSNDVHVSYGKTLYLVISGYSLFGRLGLKNTQLNNEAKQLLESNQMNEFKRRFGTNYVSQINKGVFAYIVLTINNVAEENYKSIYGSTSGKVGTKKLGVEFKAELSKEIREAFTSSRLGINVYAKGGPGLSTLAPLINNLANSDSSYVKMYQTISRYLSDFNLANSVPIMFHTASLESFGYRAEPFNNKKDKLLQKVVDNYQRASLYVTKIDNVLQDSKYSLLLDDKTTEHLDSVKQDLEIYMDTLENLHNFIKANQFVGKIIIPEVKNYDNDLPQVPVFNVCFSYSPYGSVADVPVTSYGSYGSIGFMNPNKCYIYTDRENIKSFRIIKNIKIYLDNKLTFDFAQYKKLPSSQLLGDILNIQDYNNIYIVDLFKLSVNNYDISKPLFVQPDNEDVNEKYKNGDKKHRYCYEMEIEDIFKTTRYPIMSNNLFIDDNNKYSFITETNCLSCNALSAQKINLVFRLSYLLKIDTIDTVSIAMRPMIANSPINKSDTLGVLNIPAKELIQQLKGAQNTGQPAPPLTLTSPIFFDRYILYIGEKKKMQISKDRKEVAGIYQKYDFKFTKKPGNKDIVIE